MKKFSKGLLIFIIALILVGVFSSFLCLSALYVYSTKFIDSNINFDELMSARGLTTIIYYVDENGNEIESNRLFGSENRIWADIENIPDHVKEAFISIEDHRFYEHNGVDVKRTIGAAMNFASKNKGYGGSTITQQLIKNLTGDNKISVKRKITEIVRAKKLENSISKDEILEAYLNTVYLSNGCYGIETASNFYFSKLSSELSLAEGAMLAAILQYPYKYDPIRFPDNNITRRNTVLHRMYELEMISYDEYQDAISEPIILNVNRNITNRKPLSWFDETVIDDITIALENEFGYSESTAVNMIYSGGLRIITTQNKQIQDALERIYTNERHFPASGVLTPPQSSAVIIDPHTGALLGIVGARGNKNSDRILNYATRLTRSPGSVIKPLSVYAPALDKDLITWASVFDDVPISFTLENSGEYSAWPKNNPRIYSGLTNINHAIETSINTVSVKVLEKLGVENSYEFLKKLGITTLIERKTDKNGNILSDISEAPLALGATTNGCSLYQITGAYTMLASGGIYRPVHSYTKVYDRNGALLLSFDESETRMISEDSADIMTRMLQNVVKKGTAVGMSISKKVDVAGKTGTSNANTDKWFIGYTPDYLCGIWYGYVDSRDMGSFKSNPACDIFNTVMSSIYENNKTLLNNRFNHSSNVVKCLYCRDSGLLGSSCCSDDPRGNRIEVGYFKKGTEPKNHCDTHIYVNYDTVDGGVIWDEVLCENCKKVALVKNYERRFPCQVIITDAQYTYRNLPVTEKPSLNENEAFFQSLEKQNHYFGISNVKSAFNRIHKKNSIELCDDLSNSSDILEYED